MRNRFIRGFIIVSFLLVLFVGIGNAIITFLPNIRYIHGVNGNLDSTPFFSPSKEDILVLEGEWEYYPGELLSSEDFKHNSNRSKSYISYPSYWSEDKEHFEEAKGYATYRMQVLLPKDFGNIGIYSRMQYGAYRIYLNGVEVLSVGKLSTDPSEHYISYMPQNGYATTKNSADGHTAEIILQIQNYEHKAAGFSGHILIGEANRIKLLHEFLIFVNSITGGFLIILFAYFVLVYHGNHFKQEYIEFAVVTLMSTYLCFASYGETFLYRLVPRVPGILLFKMEYLALFIASYFANHSLALHYSKHKLTGRFIKVTSYIGIIFIVFSPAYVVSIFRTELHMIPTSFFVITLFYMTKEAIRTKDSTVYLETAGIIILMLGIFFNKINFSVIEGMDSFSIMISIYCFTKIKIFLNRYLLVESDLKKMTENLELKIKERTEELLYMKERAEVATRSKSDFLASMSHEIRTPMNAIIGMSDLIPTDNLNEKQLEYFGDIKKMSNSLLHIINDILDFSKIESGKFEICPINYNVLAMIDNVCSILQFTADAKGLSFTKDIHEGIPKVLYGDEIRVRQILTNLINNAIKYTKTGSVKFSVYTETMINEPQICFSIEDSGIGIKEDDLKKLFVSFERLDSKKNYTTTGTGLGLVISRNLAEMMNGRISVRSEYEKGSCFTVHLPMILGDAHQILQVEEISNYVYGQSILALVVDDNTVNLKVAKAMLELHRIVPDTAESGADALKMIEVKPYDIIFMDHMMPEMDGIETTKRIRAQGFYDHIPIIALTANAVMGTKELLLKEGMDDYLSKPIDRIALNKVLSKWLPKGKIVFEEASPTADPKAAALESANYHKLNDEEQLIFYYLDQIRELDVPKALMYLNGNKKLYLTIITEYISSIDEIMKRLQSMFDSGSWNDYSIIVHGLKSSLRNLGSSSLSEDAYILELSSKALDGEGCKQRHADFCNGIQEFTARLKQLLPDTQALARNPVSPDAMKELLTKLHKAAYTGNAVAAFELSEQLQKASADGYEESLLKTIEDKVASLDFDVVLEVLETLGIGV